MSPLVSVVIPCFNRVHTIGQAIDSVLRQTVQDFEIIVVDDASSEDLAAALSPFLADPRMRSLRHAVNKGPAAARNSGVAAATGRFVAFLDSDDVWMPEKLRRQCETVLAAPDPDNVLCMTRTRILLDGGYDIVRPVRGPSPGRTMPEYLYTDGGFAQTSCIFLSRLLARRIPFREDFRQLEDHIFVIEVTSGGAQYVLIDDVLTVWSNISASDRASSADDLQKWTDVVSRFRKHAEAYAPPRVLLSGEIRLLSDRLWGTARGRLLMLLCRGLLAGALSPREIAALLGRNALPPRMYNGVRQWLDARKAGVEPQGPPGAALDPDGARTLTPEERRAFLNPLPTASGGRSIVFITDELFLPPRNGSQQTYAGVAQSFAEAGWTIFCVSFFREPEVALSPRNIEAYSQTFADFLLLPGWNRGGTLLGRLGQMLREVNRSLTGNVLPSHPFLVTKNRHEVRRIAERIRTWNTDAVYVHKVHGMQLLGRVLDTIQAMPIILDLHDDFVVRATHYQEVHRRLFPVLPFRSILRDHASAWVRHHFSRFDQEHSRAVEEALMRRAGLIVVNSVQEAAAYTGRKALAGKVVLSPLTYNPPGCTPVTGLPGDFDGGFIGSEDVINLDALIYFRDEILPRIKAARPAFQFLVAGRVARVARPVLQGVADLTIWDRTDTVESFYDAVKVTIIPVRYGTGVSVRFLEAQKFGKPIVSTTVGVRGLASTSLGNAIVADEPGEFAAAVVGIVLAADRVPRDGIAH